MPTAPDIVGGILVTEGTSQVEQTRRVASVDDVIKHLQPDEAPLTTVLMALGTPETVENPEFSTLELQDFPRTDKLSALITDTATTINVVTGARWREGDIGYFPSSRERFQVTTVAANALTVTRDLGSLGLNAEIASGAEVKIISVAYAEGVALQTSRRSLVNPRTNYTQNIREPFFISTDLKNSALYGSKRAGNELNRIRGDALRQLKLQCERALILGVPSSTGSGVTQRRTTGGIHYFANLADDVRVKNFATGMTLEAWLDFEAELARYSSNRRIAIAGNKFMAKFMRLAVDHLDLPPRGDTFNVQFTRWMGQIEILFKSSSVMSEIHPDDAIIIDPDCVRLVQMAGGEAQLEKDGRDMTTTEDGVLHSWRKSVGLKMWNPDRFGAALNASYAI